jgi:hypothetical protein
MISSGMVGFSSRHFRQLRHQPLAGERARARHPQRRLHVLFHQQRHCGSQRIKTIAQGRIEPRAGAGQQQRPRAPLKQFYPARLFQLPDLVADRRRRDAELVGGRRKTLMPGGGLEGMERAKRRQLSHSASVDEVFSSST